MTEKNVYLTQEGLEKLKRELEFLHTHRRPEVIDKIKKAIESGSMVNNAEYDEAKNEQSFVEGRIMTIESEIKNATIIDEKVAGKAKSVKLGSHIAVKTVDGEEERYTIVGRIEADPGNGKISNESPIGQALMGKRVGDKVKVQVPSGIIKLTVLEIS
ncbi:MAG: transcription elongation factor GreA [Chloroflexi bacterium]|nr:transcription elongation factor GreA [Chloroflexota bacterium]